MIWENISAYLTQTSAVTAGFFGSVPLTVKYKAVSLDAAHCASLNISLRPSHMNQTHFKQ